MKTSGSLRAVTSATDQLRDEIGDLLFAIADETKTRALEALAEYDLTLTQGLALHELEQPQRMRELAETLGFDASHVTGIVDGLEDRGLVERRADPHDRRVKVLVITAAGAKLRREIEGRVFLPPSGLERLTAAQCRELRELLVAVRGPAGTEVPSRRSFSMRSRPEHQPAGR
jgi:DNA-binding MarR family transcriptional regulator